MNQIAREAAGQCAGYASQYLKGSELPDGMGLYYYMPPKSAWDHGERGVTCFFGSRSGKVTGSVTSGGSVTGGDSGGQDGTDGGVGGNGGGDGGTDGGSDGSSGGDPGIGV